MRNAVLQVPIILFTSIKYLQRGYMSRYKDNYTNISVSNEIYEELSRRKTNPKESMDSTLRRLVNKDTSGYKQDVDLQSKKDLLEKIKRSHDLLGKSFDSLDKEIIEAVK